MKIFITGGTGFVGRNLTQAFLKEGHRVTVLTRSTDGDRLLPDGLSYLQGDPKEAGKWQETLHDHEVIINLAGSSIFRRWTEKAKRSIRESRLLTTRNIVQALEGSQGQGKVFFSTSAIGYYGSRGEEPLAEDSPSGTGFLSDLSRESESTALEAREFGARVILTRFGIVLGRHGGALKQMIPLFKWFLGSPLGKGGQWFSWIHEEDLSRIYLFLMDETDASGPVNCTAPNPVRNRDLTRSLGKALGRPTFMPAVPGWLMRFILGEFGSVLLEGQKVLPKRLQELGFNFLYPEVETALNDLTA